jgi:hypothetical protein
LDQERYLTPLHSTAANTDGCPPRKPTFQRAIPQTPQNL